MTTIIAYARDPLVQNDAFFNTKTEARPRRFVRSFVASRRASKKYRSIDAVWFGVDSRRYVIHAPTTTMTTTTTHRVLRRFLTRARITIDLISKACARTQPLSFVPNRVRSFVRSLVTDDDEDDDDGRKNVNRKEYAKLISTRMRAGDSRDAASTRVDIHFLQDFHRRFVSRNALSETHRSRRRPYKSIDARVRMRRHASMSSDHELSPT